jgi:hypothetical protein
MSKKVALIAVSLAICTALIKLPAMASAQEQQVDPGAGTTIAGGAWWTINSVSNEPPYTCESTDVTGEFTSKSTGTITFDSTSCHTVILGFTQKCRSPGSPLDNTVASTSTFHMITINNKPGFLLTPPFPTVTCAGIAIQFKGNGLIGTVTSPVCATESKVATIKFDAEGGVQKQMSYTGTNYDQTYVTESGGVEITAGVISQFSLEFSTKIKMTCE